MQATNLIPVLVLVVQAGDVLDVTERRAKESP